MVWRCLVGSLAIAASVLTSCLPGSQSGGQVAATAQPSPSAPGVFSPTGSTSAPTFRLTGEQAREVSILVSFVSAYNNGSLPAALSLLTENVNISDCDYQHHVAVQFNGQAEAEAWLRQRFSDHDQLRIESIADENRQQPLGVLGVSWARRTSDTLRLLGFEDGIRPQSGAKVIFMEARIWRFAMGPVGGQASLCNPLSNRAPTDRSTKPLPTRLGAHGDDPVP
jgi:hypothetical protein